MVAILSAARRRQATFRGNWLLVYVNACCHLLFTPLTGKEAFASVNRSHVFASRPDSAADVASEYVHILSLFFFFFCLTPTGRRRDLGPALFRGGARLFLCFGFRLLLSKNIYDVVMYIYYLRN